MAVVRYREENGKISRKCGNTLIQTLRKTYGRAFAPGCADYAKLRGGGKRRVSERMRWPIKQFKLGGQHRDTQVSFGAREVRLKSL
jgi:hypothetical protein